MPLDLLDAIARTVAYGVGAGIFVNVLDDAFIDARYFLGGLGDKRTRVLDEEDLKDVRQQRIAIMLPAWKEADVIEEMLEHNLSAIDYSRDLIDVFCGTYQNDPETQARVDAAARRFKNVHKVVVPHDGPTSKADCLNWIHQGILLEEERSNRRFEILLMHDAEDIIHPLSLRLYSLLIPTYDFVQTPVFSLPLPKTSFVSGTYIDEFAEHHLKDMLVREAIGGLVPSAGVGSAFARDAFEEIAAANGQQPFNVDSLTEDYEIGLKFRLANRRTHFACHSVMRDGREEVIATREFFPSEFTASVRQRSRWILGITMQTWQQIGWRGALPVLYCLWRDRKALFTNALLLCAYALLLYTLGRSAVDDAWSFDAIVAPTSALTWVLGANFAFAGWRMAMKANFVGRLYGIGHAFLSWPRLFLGNVIGILATCRATYQYVSHRMSGEPLRWLKTAHEFPTADRLNRRRRLGEYLLELAAVSEKDLDEGLELQRMSGAPIGDVLETAGLATPEAVAEALARQHDVAPAKPDPYAIPLSLLRRVPEALAAELDVLPLEEIEERAVVAAAGPIDSDGYTALEKAVGKAVELRIAPRRSLHDARDRAYRRLVSERTSTAPPPPPDGATPLGAAVDRRAVAQLGIGFCTFHAVVPMKTRLGETPVIFCAAPLHRAVRAAIVLRLGSVPMFEVASTATALRVALAAVEGTLPTVALEAGFFGLDAVEWRVLRRELAGKIDLGVFAGEAQEKGLSPLEHLETSGAVDDALAARARALTFGLRVAKRGKESAAGLLPPRLAAANDITVLDRDEESVALGAPRPTPHLAQEVAALLAPLKVAWSVAPRRRS